MKRVWYYIFIFVFMISSLFAANRTVAANNDYTLIDENYLTLELKEVGGVEQYSIRRIKAGVTLPSGNLEIPSHVNGIPITSIGDSAFRDSGVIGKLKLSDSLKTIEVAAFQNNGITSVIAPGVTHIEDWAFSENTIVTADLPEVVEIGLMAFSHNQIKALNLPNATFVGRAAFEYNGIKEFNAPSLVHVDIESFKGNHIESLNLPSLEFADNGAFDSNLLTSVVAPKLKRISTYTFSNNPDLKTINVSNKLEGIDFYSFFNNKLIEEFPTMFNITASEVEANVFDWDSYVVYNFDVKH